MKDLIRDFVLDAAGKNLIVRTSKGMGERYLLRQFGTEIGAEIISGPLRPRHPLDGGEICLLPPDISARQFGLTVRAVPSGRLVFESMPSRLDVRLLPILADGKSGGQFNGKLLVLAGDHDTIPALGDSFVVFEQLVTSALQTLAIARNESLGIAGGLTSGGLFHSRAMVRLWADITREVLVEAATSSRISLLKLASRIPLSLSQFMIMLRLFPVIYPTHRDVMTRKEWISENLGLGSPPFLKGSSRRVDPASFRF